MAYSFCRIREDTNIMHAVAGIENIICLWLKTSCHRIRLAVCYWIIFFFFSCVWNSRVLPFFMHDKSLWQCAVCIIHTTHLDYFSNRWLLLSVSLSLSRLASHRHHSGLSNCCDAEWFVLYAKHRQSPDKMRIFRFCVCRTWEQNNRIGWCFLELLCVIHSAHIGVKIECIFNFSLFDENEGIKNYPNYSH